MIKFGAFEFAEQRLFYSLPQLTACRHFITHSRASAQADRQQSSTLPAFQNPPQARLQFFLWQC
jgi:hypothetical protein